MYEKMHISSETIGEEMADDAECVALLSWFVNTYKCVPEGGMHGERGFLK
jgi:hypothetical protein